MTHFRETILTVAAIIALPVTTHAQMIASKGHWQAHAYTDFCWAETTMHGSSLNIIRNHKGPHYVSYEHTGNMHQNHPPKLLIGSRTFQLEFADTPDTAFSSDADDAAAISAIRRANTATVEGASAWGRKFSVTFSLTGSTAADNAARNCAAQRQTRTADTAHQHIDQNSECEDAHAAAGILNMIWSLDSDSAGFNAYDYMPIPDDC
ncbi:MAG: hypothetical protein OXI79_00225 [Gammaproteobacteria bacterium]|nr:hypothetical protein [Gammaproteobacteria bacterium]